MFDPDKDTYAYWFGYMFATVKKTAGNGDALSINSLRKFCDHSRFALDTDREVLEQAVSNPRDLAQKSAGLEAQDATRCAALGYPNRTVGPITCQLPKGHAGEHGAWQYAETQTGAEYLWHNESPGFSRRVPDTPGLRLAGVFECQPDESCGARDGVA